MKEILSNRNILKIATKAEIIKEYSAASKKKSDYQMAKWGSNIGMINRFKLGLSLINFSKIETWLDIGCGNGSFFSYTEEFKNIKVIKYGLDICVDLLKIANKRNYENTICFMAGDLEYLPYKENKFDLLTMIGVLQKCGSSPEIAIKRCINQITSEGKLFLTTKNIGWTAFVNKELMPDPNHSWFQYEELLEILKSLGINVLSSGGFLPRTGKIVNPSDSHTIFFYGTKK